MPSIKTYPVIAVLNYLFLAFQYLEEKSIMVHEDTIDVIVRVV
jgi:hypothetical protein